jgi:hypothetical protein
MRTPAFRKRARGREISRTHSVSAPVKGWNAKDSLADMKEGYAAETDNWFGNTTDVRVRKGYSEHVTGIGQQVESLMPYNAQDGTQTLFAAANDSFYNVTSAGAVGAAVVGSLTNARWQYVNFTNSAGNSYLCCFNGTDAPRYWDNSNWITITDASTPAITGVTTTDIVNATIFKRRMYLILNNSLSLYYLPVDSVGGATARTRLDGYFSKGGYLVAAETWTLDAGEGSDDHLVVVSSEGQVAVFKGTNPSSTNSWGLIGIWNIGEPIGSRCLIKYAGDILTLTVQGVFPLSGALQSSQTNPQVALTDMISTAFTDASVNYRSNYGWNMTFFPQGNQVLVNVPVSEGSKQEQYVMNTLNGAWWRFTEIEANCWAISNEKMYFGGDGVVGHFGELFADKGLNIDAQLKQAFTYLGAKGRLKQVNSVRPNFLSNGTPAVYMGVAVDFGDDVQGQAALTFTPSPHGLWDAALWDGATWGGDVSSFNDWQTVNAVGTAIALQLSTISNGLDVRYTASDYLYEYGGVIG